MSSLSQIYHVSRCGSTLLACLLSSAADTYVEPSWGKRTWRDREQPHPSWSNSIVKYQSMATAIGYKPDGPKVFLYRPLAQHLAKAKELDVTWLRFRYRTIQEFLPAIQEQLGVDIEPSGSYQAFAMYWSACVMAMIKQENVLWVQSNELFADKQATATAVLKHFGIDGEPDMRFAELNVKKLKFNGQSAPVRYPGRPHDPEMLVTVNNNHGVYSDKDSLADPGIRSTIEWVRSSLPDALHNHC